MPRRLRLRGPMHYREYCGQGPAPCPAAAAAPGPRTEPFRAGPTPHHGGSGHCRRSRRPPRLQHRAPFGMCKALHHSGRLLCRCRGGSAGSAEPATSRERGGGRGEEKLRAPARAACASPSPGTHSLPAASAGSARCPAAAGRCRRAGAAACIASAGAARSVPRRRGPRWRLRGRPARGVACFPSSLRSRSPPPPPPSLSPSCTKQLSGFC